MYIPLYVKSSYSLLSSLVNIKELISFCKNNNIPSISICDDNMFGVMEFIKECEKNSIKPIVGLDVYIDDYNILCYAENYDGYKNLIKLATIQSERLVTLDDIKKYNSNIICVIPWFYRNLYDQYFNIFKSLFIGISSRSEEDSTDKPCVYINKTLCIEKAKVKYLKYLTMIRDNKTVSSDYDINYNDNYLKIDNIYNYASNRSIQNTLLIGDKCNIVFPYNDLLLPIYKTDNDLSSFDYLSNLVLKGLNKRFNNNYSSIYLDRVKYELSIINKMGFSNYFLVVYDFIKYAKKNKILVGPGRGSAGGSLVAYCLGITDIDPIKYDLLFERFLNPERVSMPDIDTDFPDIYRDQIIKYVTDKYGIKNVCGIVTFGTMGAKQVIRDVSRVLNINLNKVDLICKTIPSMSKLTLKDFYAENIRFKNLIDSENSLKKMFEIALVFEGIVRHTSVHAAGIVMSKVALDEVIPLYYSDNSYLTGYSMEYLEELGLLKMDFLGLKNLTIIMNVIDDIKKLEGVDIDFSKIPLDDKDALNLFYNADTSGIFQFESVGMRNFLRKLKPTSFEDIFSAIALFRPGPMSNIDSYIRRKNGIEKIDYIDPSLESILKNTYGIIIYQEQIMQIATVVSGYSLGEADILRRAMSKKKMDVLKNEEDKFINGAIKNGYTYDKAKTIFDLILRFANYGFNRAHSVAYSIIAYKMAYLKARYKKEFFSNLLTNAIGSDSKTLEYIYEIKSYNIDILKPDINTSSDKYLATSLGILFPLSNIRNVGSVSCRQILESRKDGFKDIFDCIYKLNCNGIAKKTIESLIYASCFDCFNYNKKTLIENLSNILNYVELIKDLDSSLVLKPNIEIVDDYSKEELILKEKELFGFYLSNHPVLSYKNKYNTISLSDVSNYLNKKVEVIILVDKIKIIDTKNNDKMAFIVGSDDKSSVDFTLFPKVYNKFNDIEKGNILKINGEVNKRFDKIQIVVNDITKLS